MHAISTSLSAFGAPWRYLQVAETCKVRKHQWKLNGRVMSANVWSTYVCFALLYVTCSCMFRRNRIDFSFGHRLPTSSFNRLVTSPCEPPQTVYPRLRASTDWLTPHEKLHKLITRTCQRSQTGFPDMPQDRCNRHDPTLLHFAISRTPKQSKVRKHQWKLTKTPKTKVPPNYTQVID